VIYYSDFQVCSLSIWPTPTSTLFPYTTLFRSEEKAVLLTKKNAERIKFRWDVDAGTDYYFELRIQVDEITKDVSLMITDFAEDGEVEEGKMLWENMVSELKQILGST